MLTPKVVPCWCCRFTCLKKILLMFVHFVQSIKCLSVCLSGLIYKIHIFEQFRMNEIAHESEPKSYVYKWRHIWQLLFLECRELVYIETLQWLITHILKSKYGWKYRVLHEPMGGRWSIAWVLEKCVDSGRKNWKFEEGLLIFLWQLFESGFCLYTDENSK